MKCPYCNAEVKRGLTVCPYCESEIENKADIQERREAAAAKSREATIKAVIKALVIVVIVMVVVGALLVLGSLAIVTKSDLAGNTGKSSVVMKNETDLTGTVIGDVADGKVTVLCKGSERKNVEILDKDFLDWLEETGESLEDRNILFSTNEDGDIRKIALGSAETFLILDADADSGTYTACMGPQIIRFNSQTLLQKNTLYVGYFAYPKRELVSVNQSASYEGVSMPYDAVSEGKRSVQKEVLYTGEEVTLYQIGYGGNWYYCSQEIYDTLEDGERLLNYTFYSRPPCVTCP